MYDFIFVSAILDINILGMQDSITFADGVFEYG